MRLTGVPEKSVRVEPACEASRGSVDCVEALRACRGENRRGREAAVKAKGPPILRRAGAPCRAAPLLLFRSAVPNCRERSWVEGLGAVCCASTLSVHPSSKCLLRLERTSTEEKREKRKRHLTAVARPKPWLVRRRPLAGSISSGCSCRA